MQTLMNSQEPKRLFRLGDGTKKIVAAIGAVSLITAGVVAKKYRDYRREFGFRNGIATYMGLPKFSGRDFAEKAMESDARFKLYDVDNNVIYFGSTKKPEDVLHSVSEQPERAKILGNQEKRKLFDSYPGNIFSFPVADLRLDRNKVVTTDFGNVTYDISLAELSDLIDGRSICGSYEEVSTEMYVGIHGLTNHQFYMSKKGEPSLDRFTKRLINGVDTNEIKAQALLNFVTRKIRYDGSYTLGGPQKIKRANEVLMTKEADCSGKSTLYASLLEQANIDYYMMYFLPESGDGHMAIAVEGNFPDRNGLSFNINGKRYSIAETTMEGFRIGLTQVERADNIYRTGKRYVQMACSRQGRLHRAFQLISSDSDIIDFDTGIPLKTAY